jgi:transposase
MGGSVLLLTLLPQGHRKVAQELAGQPEGLTAIQGDPQLPEGIHIAPLPPYSPELDSCEQLCDILKDTEGFSNGLFESIKNLRKAL